MIRQVIEAMQGFAPDESVLLRSDWDDAGEPVLRVIYSRSDTGWHKPRRAEMQLVMSQDADWDLADTIRELKGKVQSEFGAIGRRPDSVLPGNRCEPGTRESGA